MSCNQEGSLLEAEDIRVSFNIRRKAGKTAVPILRGISFSLYKGKALGLIGESGSGKSVLAAALLRLLPDSARLSGKIRFRGEDTMGWPEKKLRKLRGSRIGLVHQNPELALNPLISIGRQIIEGPVLRGAGRKEAWEKGLELLSRLGLAAPETLFRSYPHRLSGGMNQRVLIAAAAAAEPELLIVDEPSTGLDDDAKAAVLKELELLRDNFDTELLLITHDLPFLKKATAQCGVLYAGELLEWGETETILQDPLHPYLRALLGALPGGGFVPIPGPAYSPWQIPEGCGFYPRCPHAWRDCAGTPPPEIRRGNRMVRCLLYT